MKSNCEKASKATGHPEQGGEVKGPVGDRGELLLKLSPLAPAASTADITMEKRFVLKIVSLSLVLCKSHQENVETEIHPDAHSEDDDAGGHSAELDAE